MGHGSSLLLGIDGLVVDSVLLDASGRRVVHCSTDPGLAGWCPDCRQQSSSQKERVTTRPRDVRIGPDRPDLLCHKRKWHCRVPECERKVFTEALPEEIPARARITTRARRAAARSIGDHLRPVSGARCRGRIGHGLADRAQRVRRLRRRGAARRLMSGRQSSGKSKHPAPVANLDTSESLRNLE